MDSAAANQEFLQLLPGIHPCDGFFLLRYFKKGRAFKAYLYAQKKRGQNRGNIEWIR